MTHELNNNNFSKDSDKVFSTFDLGCSAALLTAGFELIDLDRTNQRKVRFVFCRKKNIEKIADNFWSNQLKQKSRSYWDNLKMLKNRLYSDE